MNPRTISTTVLTLLAVSASAVAGEAAFAAPPAEGSFVKGGGATIYLIHQGQRRGIPTWPTFMALGTQGRATTIPDAELDAIPVGPNVPASAERLPIKGSEATVYVMERGKKRPVPSWEMFLALGFQGPETVTLPDANIALIPTGAPFAAPPADGTFVKGSGATIYLVHQGKRRGIPTWPTFMALGTQGRATTIPDAALNDIPVGPNVPAGAERLPIKGSEATVYLMEGGKKRAIPTWDTFLALGFQGPDIVTLPDANIALIPAGPVMEAK